MRCLKVQQIVCRVFHQYTLVFGVLVKIELLSQGTLLFVKLKYSLMCTDSCGMSYCST